MKYYCNPINIDYRYQFNGQVHANTDSYTSAGREAADPSLILFQGRYYIFASMQLAVWVSDDLVNWESHRLPDELPLYDYAPDVCQVGEYVYLCASRRGEICDYYRTKDILNGPYEKINGTFDFWDPHMFCDDDGQIYFYWGCSNITPIYGTRLDPDTLHPLTDPLPLIDGDPFHRGYERVGTDHTIFPLTEEETDAAFEAFLKMQNVTADQVPPALLAQARGLCSNRPYIEGPWMTKHQGKYYLQYAVPGTQYNIYGDGVYVSDHPLGPFHPAKNNPYSYQPGGFITGAGHGSTIRDKAGQLWHVSSMYVGRNFDFERRVGLWRAGFDEEGELFCCQRYGDWPAAVPEEGESAQEALRKSPPWYPLGYHKIVTASSFEEGHEPALAADENVRTCWRAASAAPGEWILMDLEQNFEIHAVQVNFADEGIDVPLPGEIRGTTQPRYIDGQPHVTRWKLEGSVDGISWFVIEDKSAVGTDLPHDFIVREEGFAARFLKLTVFEVPYGQPACICGLRVFGLGQGSLPEALKYSVSRESGLDMTVTAQAEGAIGYNILWGSSKEKLYHSYLVYADAAGAEMSKHIGALVDGQQYVVRVDAFNENGLTQGAVYIPM